MVKIEFFVEIGRSGFFDGYSPSKFVEVGNKLLEEILEEEKETINDLLKISKDQTISFSISCYGKANTKELAGILGIPEDSFSYADLVGETYHFRMEGKKLFFRKWIYDDGRSYRWEGISLSKRGKVNKIFKIVFPGIQYAHHTCGVCGGLPRVSRFRIEERKNHKAASWDAECEDCGTIISQDHFTTFQSSEMIDFLLREIPQEYYSCE